MVRGVDSHDRDRGGTRRFKLASGISLVPETP